MRAGHLQVVDDYVLRTRMTLGELVLQARVFASIDLGNDTSFLVTNSYPLEDTFTVQVGPRPTAAPASGAGAYRWTCSGGR